jgi:hypothetical protein
MDEERELNYMLSACRILHSKQQTRARERLVIVSCGRRGKNEEKEEVLPLKEKG